MATPTRSQAAGTPKNPFITTPNRPTASPRPNTGAVPSRAFTHKSPAVKTPASTHSTAHRVSISSHPTSTPMAAPAIHEELLNLNSPAAALIASIGQTGLTPLPSGTDGLGITTGITPTPAKDLSALRDPQTERIHRLQQVVDLLRSKTIGRGVTRDGIMRIGKLERFEALWIEDNLLSLACKTADLEITFDSTTPDLVTDVVLNLPTTDSDVPEVQRDASAILKDDLRRPREHPRATPYKNLDNFATNLRYLSQLDHIESSISGFELVRNLYTTMRKIWDAEKTRRKWRNDAHHICHSNVGRPMMYVNNRLGVITQYWAPGAKSQSVSASSADDPEDNDRDTEVWIARFTCEPGLPSISAKQDWLAEESLSETLTTEELFQESRLEKPNWQDPTTSTREPEGQVHNDEMNIDQPQILPESLTVRFVAQLEPTILLPVNVAAALNRQSPMVVTDQSKVLTFQQALQQETGVAAAGAEMRWVRPVTVFDESGMKTTHPHSYALYTANTTWVLPVDKLYFTHPQQLAEALLTLRQFAFLWKLLKTITAPKSDSHPISTATAMKHKNVHNRMKASTVIKRSNKRSSRQQLNLALGTEISDDDSTPIDIRLDVVSDLSKAKVEVYVPVGENLSQKEPHFVRMAFEVLPNAEIQIIDVQGTSPASKDSLERKLVKVLKASENMGMTIEWLLRSMRCTS